MSQPINTSRTKLNPGKRRPFLQVDSTMRSNDQIRDYSLLQTRAINRIAEEIGLAQVDQPVGAGGFGGAVSSGGGSSGGSTSIDTSQFTKRNGSAQQTADWNMNNKKVTNVQNLSAQSITLDGKDLEDRLGYLENFAWLMG